MNDLLSNKYLFLLKQITHRIPKIDDKIVAKGKKIKRVKMSSYNLRVKLIVINRKNTFK